MKIAITGSSGFIGTHLINRLKKDNFEILEIDLQKGIDLLDWQSLQTLPSFDCLIHLAAKIFVPNSYKDSLDFYNTNVTGTLHALELCKQKKAKMIFFSSYVYGQPKYLPIDEKHPIDAFNPYADTKIKGEELCKSYNRFFDVPVVVFRPFNAYGDGQNPNFLIPKIIKLAKEKQKIVLHDPNPKRDYIHISDITEAVVKAINHKFEGFEIFNLGSGTSYSVKEIVSFIQELFNDELDIEFTGEKRENEVMDTVSNIKKMKNYLDWTPKVKLENGLRDLL